MDRTRDLTAVRDLVLTAQNNTVTNGALTAKIYTTRQSSDVDELLERIFRSHVSEDNLVSSWSHFVSPAIGFTAHVSEYKNVSYVPHLVSQVRQKISTMRLRMDSLLSQSRRVVNSNISNLNGLCSFLQCRKKCQFFFCGSTLFSSTARQLLLCDLWYGLTPASSRPMKTASRLFSYIVSRLILV